MDGAHRMFKSFLWLLVVVTPGFFVYAGDWAFWTVTDRPYRFNEEPDILFIRAVLVLVPFLLLAVKATFKNEKTSNQTKSTLLQAALIGIGLNLLFWGYYYYDGYIYWRDQPGTGANIGLGILMLLSPLLIGYTMYLPLRKAQRG
jgi:hypothetical protein